MAVPQLSISNRGYCPFKIMSGDWIPNYWWPKADLYLQTSAQTVWWSNCGRQYSSIWEWWIKEAAKAAKLHDTSWSDHPCTAVIPDTIHYVDELIRGDSCTTDEFCSILTISKGCEIAITEELGYSNIYAWWVPQRWHINTHRQGNWPSLILASVPRLPIKTVIQGMTSGFHHPKPESKWQSMECQHMTFPRRRRKKFNSMPSAGKVMVTILWDWKFLLFSNSCLGAQQWTVTTILKH